MTRLVLVMICLMLASCFPSETQLLAGPNAVQHLAEGRPVDIPPMIAVLQAEAPFAPRFNLVLPGHRAPFRVSGPQPTFFSIYPGPEIRLFRLVRGDDHDDRNLKVRTGPLRILPAMEVELDVLREGDGLYRVTPRGPLLPGEYAFMSQVDLEGWKKYPSKVKLYSFGVD